MLPSGSIQNCIKTLPFEFNEMQVSGYFVLANKKFFKLSTPPGNSGPLSKIIVPISISFS
jgi:hypothetical protein